MLHGRTGDPLVSRSRRALLDAGTRVTIQRDGHPFGGVVQPLRAGVLGRDLPGAVR